MEAWKDELYHHGIEGMKWGVRRYQNPDGTRTEEGKRRERERWSNDALDVDEIKKKHVKEMTNDELKKLNERQRLENERERLEIDYNKLHPSDFKRYSDKGFEYLKNAVTLSATVLTLYNNSDRLIKIGKNAVDVLLK